MLCRCLCASADIGKSLFSEGRQAGTHLLLRLSYQACLIEEDVWHGLQGCCVSQDPLKWPGAKHRQGRTVRAKPFSPCCQQPTATSQTLRPQDQGMRVVCVVACLCQRSNINSKHVSQTNYHLFARMHALAEFLAKMACLTILTAICIRLPCISGHRHPFAMHHPE